MDDKSNKKVRAISSTETYRRKLIEKNNSKKIVRPFLNETYLLTFPRNTQILFKCTAHKGKGMYVFESSNQQIALTVNVFNKYLIR